MGPEGTAAGHGGTDGGREEVLLQHHWGATDTGEFHVYDNMSVFLM